MLVRILLDTCVIRGHLHESGTPLDLIAIHRSSEQLRFSIPGGTWVELLEQLTEERLKWTDWANKIPAIDSILDNRWPILPTNKKLAALAGTHTDVPIDEENVRRHMKAIWHLTRHSKSTQELEKGEFFRRTDGEIRQIKLEISKLKEAANSERELWKNIINKTQDTFKRSGHTPSEGEMVALLKEHQGTHPGDPPNLSEKLDSVIRMIAHFVSQSLRENDPYNPCTTNRRGDAFDLSLLFYISLPCVICTADKRFANRLRGTNALHASQVVTVDEFNDLVNSENVTSLVSSFRTPSEQHRQWRERAYFKWKERGCPLWDADKDWQDAEPVA